jgi:hypothetical protein
MARNGLIYIAVVVDFMSLALWGSSAMSVSSFGRLSWACSPSDGLRVPKGQQESQPCLCVVSANVPLEKASSEPRVIRRQSQRSWVETVALITNYTLTDFKAIREQNPT